MKNIINSKLIKINRIIKIRFDIEINVVIVILLYLI